MKPQFESLNSDNSRLMRNSAAIALAGGLLLAGAGTANAVESAPAAAQETASYHDRLVAAAGEAADTLAHKIDRLSYAGPGALAISKTDDSATLKYGLSVENKIPYATSEAAVYDLSYTSELGTRIPNPNKPTDISIIERGGTGVGKTYVYKMHKTESGNWKFVISELTSHTEDGISFKAARFTTARGGRLPTITPKQLTRFTNLATEELQDAAAQRPITLARNVLN